MGYLSATPRKWGGKGQVVGMKTRPNMLPILTTALTSLSRWLP